MEIECCIFCFFLFNQRVQILKTEYTNTANIVLLSASQIADIFLSWR